MADKWAEYLLSGSGSGSGTGEDGSGSGTGEAEDCVTVGSPSFGDYAPTDCVDQFSFLCQIRGELNVAQTVAICKLQLAILSNLV